MNEKESFPLSLPNLDPRINDHCSYVKTSIYCNMVVSQDPTRDSVLSTSPAVFRKKNTIFWKKIFLTIIKPDFNTYQNKFFAPHLCNKIQVLCKFQHNPPSRFHASSSKNNTFLKPLSQMQTNMSVENSKWLFFITILSLYTSTTVNESRDYVSTQVSYQESWVPFNNLW